MTKMEENAQKRSEMTVGLREQCRLRKIEQKSRVWMTPADIAAVYRSLEVPKILVVGIEDERKKNLCNWFIPQRIQIENPCTKILLQPSKAARNKLWIFQSWAFIHTEAAASITCWAWLQAGNKRMWLKFPLLLSIQICNFRVLVHWLYIVYLWKNYISRTRYRNLQTNKQTNIYKYIQQNVPAKRLIELNPISHVFWMEMKMCSDIRSEWCVCMCVLCVYWTMTFVSSGCELLKYISGFFLETLKAVNVALTSATLWCHFTYWLLCLPRWFLFGLYW